MRNQEKWLPGRWLYCRRKDRFEPNLAVIYPGSIHIAWLQIAAYAPLIREHASGRLLDCGCDTVPYFEMYKDLVAENICLDWQVTRKENPFVDVYADLNQPLPFSPDEFDTVLCTDVLPHIRNPRQLFAEFARILRPGGKAMVSTIFTNWLVEPPYEYGHFSEFALRDFCEESGLEVVHLESYGGHLDVLLDTLNKGMTGALSNRIFRVMRRLMILTSWYKRNRKKTKDRYPLGYVLIAQKNMYKSEQQ